MALSFDLVNYIINVPQADLGAPVGGIYQLDTGTFRIALKDWEDSEEGIVQPKTHNHNTQVSLGGIQYARVIEILSPWTITFQETGTPYVVSLIGSNNNILEKTNLGTVQLLSNNSAGLINVREVQIASFNNRVSYNSSSLISGTAYPAGNQSNPVNNLQDALSIASGLGFEELEIQGNLTIDQPIDGYHLYGQGATLNIIKTTITLTGTNTTNAHYHHCMVTGVQSGESNYHDCIIEALSNVHCFYERCGFRDGTGLGYTVQQADLPASHATYWTDCYSDEGVAIVDRANSRATMIIRRFTGNIMFKNNTNVAAGKIYLHMQGGTVTIDASCTTGTIEIFGDYDLVNNSGGTVINEHDWGDVVSEGAYTRDEVLRIVAAALAGTSNKVGNTITFKGVDGTTNRIIGSYDAENNRTGAVLDGG